MENQPLIEQIPRNGVETRIIVSRYPEPPPEDSKCLKFTKLVILVIFLPLILLLVSIPLTIVFILCLTCILPLYHYIRTQNQKKKMQLPPNFTKVNVGGYRVAMSYSNKCKQEKSDNSKPPVLFLPGVGVSPTTIYDHFAESFSDYRFIVYDKGSNGNSDTVPHDHKNFTRDAVGIASELHSLIHHDEFPVKNEKLLLIAGSQGGLMAQYYTHLYPEDVAGIVYMDPSTQEFFTAAPGVIWFGLNVAQYVYSVAYLIAHLGILRLYHDFLMPKSSELNSIHPKNRTAMIEHFFSAHNMWAMKLDFEYFSVSCDQIKTIRSKTEKMNIPIACLTGLNWSAAGAPEYTPIWKRVQTENIVGDSTDAIHVILPNDTHGQVCMGQVDLVKSLCDEISSKIMKK